MSPGRALDVALVVALAVAVALAARLALGGHAGVAYVPVMGPADSTPAMQGPGGAERALDAKLAIVGDYLTVEDVARGVLALQQGRLPGVAPLTAEEAARVKAQVAQADAHRVELLKVEGELADAERAQDATARAIAATFTPEQAAWVLAQRDQVSVGGIEAAYWKELADSLPPAAP